MGRLLVLLSLVFSFNGYAATPAAVPSITIAASGQNSQSLSIPLTSISGSGVNGVFSLYAGGSFTTADFYILYKNGVAYQVTAGKSAYCFNITAASATTPKLFQLISATASFSNGAASVTGGVYQCGASGGNCVNAGITGSVPSAIPGLYTFGASTYVGIQAYNTETYSIHLECFEQ